MFARLYARYAFVSGGCKQTPLRYVANSLRKIAPPLPVEIERTEIRLFSGGGTPPLQIWIQCKQLSERPGSRWLLGARGSQSEVHPRAYRLSVHEQLYLAILCEISWKGCGGNEIFRLRNISVATERCDVLLKKVPPRKIPITILFSSLKPHRGRGSFGGAFWE